MAYDARSESQRLIREGLPDRPVRLSRRHRFAPVSVDVASDAAATWFVRRGVGCFWDEIHLLVREPVGWRLLGGGGGSSGGPWSTDEFDRARGGLPAGGFELTGGSSVVRDKGSWLPLGSRWIRSSMLLVGPSVAEAVIAGRHRPVPYHGRLVVVWSSRRPPLVSLRDGVGSELSTVAPGDTYRGRRS
ncbi:hypothetical protein GCM10009687_25250 [Asanoa iriomotensis]|uniref:hypothetical protein n=2 Tax=Asanoa iriomotensis TaxID=234613 RepID=UPI0031E3B77C